jgi:hypothetical protein
MMMRKLKKYGLYAIHEGSRMGGFFVFISSDNKPNIYAVLFMPNPMEALYLASTEVHDMLKNNTLKLVKKLPKDVYDVCEANYYYYRDKNVS